MVIHCASGGQARTFLPLLGEQCGASYENGKSRKSSASVCVACYRSLTKEGRVLACGSTTASIRIPRQSCSNFSCSAACTVKTSVFLRVCGCVCVWVCGCVALSGISGMMTCCRIALLRHSPTLLISISTCKEQCLEGLGDLLFACGKLFQTSILELWSCNSLTVQLLHWQPLRGKCMRRQSSCLLEDQTGCCTGLSTFGWVVALRKRWWNVL